MIRYILHAIAFCTNFLTSAAFAWLLIVQWHGDFSDATRAFVGLWFLLNLGLVIDFLTWDGEDE